MQNSLYLYDGGAVGKNGMACGNDQLGFGTIQMGAAVVDNSIGTFGAAAQSAITHDTMKRYSDRQFGYAIQDRVGCQRKQTGRAASSVHPGDIRRQNPRI